MSSILTEIQIIWSKLLTPVKVTKRPHHRPTWTVRSYLPAGANVHPSVTHASAHPTHHPKHHLDRLSRFALLSAESPYTLQWAAPFPIKIVPSHGISGLHLIHSFLGPPESTTQTASRSVFAGLTIVTDRPTDKPHYSVCNNRPHLRT